MDRMSAMDAMFYYMEGENTPMHVGGVAVLEGPAPAYGDLVRLLAGKMDQVPRYRQVIKTVPFQLGPADLGRRPALPDPLPRAAHLAAQARRARAAAQPRRAGLRPAARHDQAGLGGLAGRGAGRRPVGADLQGAPLHDRRRGQHRPDAGDLRPRARPACDASPPTGRPPPAPSTLAAHGGVAASTPCRSRCRPSVSRAWTTSARSRWRSPGSAVAAKELVPQQIAQLDPRAAASRPPRA